MSVCLGGCTSLLGIDELQLRDGAVIPPDQEAIPEDVAPDTRVPVERTITFQDGTNAYSGTRDTYIRSNPPDKGQAHGAELIVRWENTSDKTALLRFEAIFGATAIPLTAQIESATLHLSVARTGTPAKLSEVLIPWTEDVSWDGFGATAGIDAADVGVFVGDVTATAATTEVDVTASVRRWLAAPETNHGWLFVPQGGINVEIASRDVAAITTRPSLVVRYRD